MMLKEKDEQEDNQLLKTLCVAFISVRLQRGLKLKYAELFTG